jgi:hypothetical protein
MEKLSIAILLLFVILLVGQYYTREYFATVPDATVTMSLSDLLYYSGGLNSTAATATASASLAQAQARFPNGADAVAPGARPVAANLDTYLLLKNEMSREIKDRLRMSGKSSQTQLTNVEHPSVNQGSSYLESVPLNISKCQ